MLDEHELILVVVGFIIAFLLAFGIGANDVANSFGTSVGSRVLSLKAACVLATICEISGAVLLGAKVSQTIRGGIIDLNMFNATASGDLILMYGQVSSLSSACIWLIIATFFKIPVSGTHSIVGATAGYSLVQFGWKGVKLKGLLSIVISWFASPLLSGFVSSFLFFFIKKFVLLAEEPLEPALRSLPFIYGVTILINVFSVMFGGLEVLKLDKIPSWIIGVTSLLAGILTAVVVQFLVIPYLRRKVIKRIEFDRQRGSGAWELQSNASHASKVLNYLISTRNRMISAVCPPRRDDVIIAGLDELELGPEADSQSKRSTRIDDSDWKKKTNHRDSALNSKSDLLRTIASESTLNDRTSPERLDDEEIIEETKNPSNNSGLETDIELTNDIDRLSHFTGETSVKISGLIKDRPEEAQVFSFAQIMTATFGSFAHGGNDVSNAIGPLIGLWIVATTAQVASQAQPPIWLLLYGGVGISIGLWVWGRRVIETVGEDLTTITPSSGVCIELGSAITVLAASKLGIPVSTTHCKVGSVVCVGRLRSKENVNWKLFGNIVVAWVVTLPISGGLSALIMYIFVRNM